MLKMIWIALRRTRLFWIASLAGCASSGEPIAGYPDGDMPEATSIVSNHDSVIVMAINGRKPRSRFSIVGDQSYRVPAGPCELMVGYHNGDITGVEKTLKFTAIADHKYRLNSYVAAKFTFGYRMDRDGWDARIEDEAKKGFVAETHDAKR